LRFHLEPLDSGQLKFDGFVAFLLFFFFEGLHACTHFVIVFVRGLLSFVFSPFICMTMLIVTFSLLSCLQMCHKCDGSVQSGCAVVVQNLSVRFQIMCFGFWG
jgi:hypothetical protein